MRIRSVVITSLIAAVAAGAGWKLGQQPVPAPATGLAGGAATAVAGGATPADRSASKPAPATAERAAGAAVGAAAAGAVGTAGPRPAQSVVTTKVAVKDLPVELKVNGTVSSLNIVDVRSQVANLIQKVHVAEGQFVRAGDVLFSLDDRADRANLARARANLTRNQALLADLERQLVRNEDLRNKNFISQAVLDTTKANLEAQLAAIESDKATIQSGTVALGYNTIRAPASGRLGTINMFTGSLAQPTITSLATITQIDPIAVTFAVPERELPRLLAILNGKSAGGVWVESPSAELPRKGRLSLVDNLVDQQAGTIKAKAVFENKDQALWPGQYVPMRVVLAVLEKMTVVPAAAVLTTTAGKQVFVVEADDKVSLRKVEVVQEGAGLTAVKGLEPGLRVVVEGKQNLRPGSLVREAENKSVGKGGK